MIKQISRSGACPVGRVHVYCARMMEARRNVALVLFSSLPSSPLLACVWVVALVLSGDWDLGTRAMMAVKENRTKCTGEESETWSASAGQDRKVEKRKLQGEGQVESPISRVDDP